MRVLREATPADRAALSELAYAAKAHWGYPEAWLALWRSDLELPEEAFGGWDLLVIEEKGEIRGTVWIRDEPGSDGAEVEGLWVHPESMGRGLGRALMSEAMDRARGRSRRHLRVVSDPHAVTFYERLGAVRIGTQPSSPAGRTLPVLTLDLRA